MKIQPGADDHRANKIRTIVSVLIMSVLSVIIIALFVFMYKNARQNILNTWENNVIQLARETEYALVRSEDAIDLSAYNVERMIAEGGSNEEILDYLTEEKNGYASIVDSNFTGVYGFVRGEYLDAAGWKPGEDYDPVQRPWYTEAVKKNGEIAYVSPYVNLQTGEMMISVSRMLNDGRSVLSIDVYTDGFRTRLTDIVLQKGVKSAFIIDGDGNVVVHNSKDETGKNYLRDGNDHQKLLAKRAIDVAVGDGYSEEDPENDEIIFAEAINDEWYAVIVLNESNQLRSIRYVYIALTAFLVLAILAWYLISGRIGRKYEEADRLSSEVTVVKELAEIDALSGLRNRRSGEAGVRDMISGGTKGLFALLDVDDFKTVNDNYGHDVGDLVIAAVADALRKTFRDSDIVFRLGGDEFAVYVPGVTDDAARAYLVERIRSEIGRIDIPEMDSRPVTASIGTSYFLADEGDSFEELYQRADHKMYEEKRRRKTLAEGLQPDEKKEE